MDKMGETGANLTLCSTQLAHRHDCLAMTLEQCFLPPWTAETSLRLGADFVPVIADILYGLGLITCASPISPGRGVHSLPTETRREHVPHTLHAPFWE